MTRLALKTVGLRKQQVPQVGQAGVVPQSLCEGLCSFITDLIAPHPEGRGETVKVTSSSSPHFLLRATGDAVYSQQADVSAPSLEPWPGDKSLHQPLSELLWRNKTSKSLVNIS